MMDLELAKASNPEELCDHAETGDSNRIEQGTQGPAVEDNPLVIEKLPVEKNVEIERLSTIQEPQPDISGQQSIPAVADSKTDSPNISSNNALSEENTTNQTAPGEPENQEANKDGANQNPTPLMHEKVRDTQQREVDVKTKKDENPTLFKALAVKLKKELIKTKGELQILRDTSDKERTDFQKRIQELESTLESDRQNNRTRVFTLEAQVVELKQQLESAESECQTLQRDFESYKLRATEMLQQSKLVQYADPHKKFEDERYKRLKELNEEQSHRINSLEQQLASTVLSNQTLESDVKKLRRQTELILEKDKVITELSCHKDSLSKENENLKLALQRFRSKLNDPDGADFIQQTELSEQNSQSKVHQESLSDSPKKDGHTLALEGCEIIQNQTGDISEDENILGINLPTTTLQGDYSQPTSGSSSDGSASGYVHIRPNAFEIISRSSVLKDAQIQIDNLTKAYLESENTNSLLSEQVKALKEEIRRMQRVSDRMDLADNLEYLKNVLFKFLSLDASQVEQRQRLVPVLSTVLKLSPEETSRLNSMNFANKTIMANSFFKL